MPESRPCGGKGSSEARLAADAFPLSARKGSNSKTNVFITSNRSAGQGILPQGGVSACSGNSGPRPTEISHFTKVPATPQWSCRPTITQWRVRPSCQPWTPRLQARARPLNHQPANPCLVGWTLRLTEPTPLDDKCAF